MKKKIFAIILVIVIAAAVFAACNPKEVESGSIRISGIVGINEVTIDAENATISATVTSQVSEIKASDIIADAGVNVTLYQDINCTIATNTVRLKTGLNILYAKCESNGVSFVWSLYITQMSDNDIAAATDNISVSSSFKTSYNIGEAIVQVPIIITLKNGSRINAVSTDITGYNKNTAGEQTLTVSYKGFSATVKVMVINPDNEVVNYELVGAGSTFNLQVGDALPQLQIKVTYKSGKTDNIYVATNMVTGFDTSATGNNKVAVITYAGRTFNFTYTVLPQISANDIMSIAVASNFALTYNVGDYIKSIPVIVTLRDNTKINSIADSFTGLDTSSAGTKIVVVNYKGFTTNITVNVVKVDFADYADVYERVANIVFNFYKKIGVNLSVMAESYSTGMYGISDWQDGKHLEENDRQVLISQFKNIPADDANEIIDILKLTDGKLDTLLTRCEKFVNELNVVKYSDVPVKYSIDELNYVVAYATSANIKAVQSLVIDVMDITGCVKTAVTEAMVMVAGLATQEYEQEGDYGKNELLEAASKTGDTDLIKFFTEKVLYGDEEPDDNNIISIDGSYLEKCIKEGKYDNLAVLVDSLIRTIINTDADKLSDVAIIVCDFIEYIDTIGTGDIYNKLTTSIDDVKKVIDLVCDMMYSVGSIDWSLVFDLAIDYLDYGIKGNMSVDDNAIEYDVKQIYKKVLASLGDDAPNFIKMFARGIKNLTSSELITIIDAIKSSADVDGSDESIGKAIVLGCDIFADIINESSASEKASLLNLISSADEVMNTALGADKSNKIMKQYYDLIFEVSNAYDYNNVPTQYAINLVDKFISIIDDYFETIWNNNYGYDGANGRLEISGMSSSQLFFNKGADISELLDILNMGGVIYYPDRENYNDYYDILATKDNVTGFVTSEVGKYTFQIEYGTALLTYDYYVLDENTIETSKYRFNFYFNKWNEKPEYYVGEKARNGYYNDFSCYRVVSFSNIKEDYETYALGGVYVDGSYKLIGFDTTTVGDKIAFLKDESSAQTGIYIPYYYTVVDNTPAEDGNIVGMEVLGQYVLIEGDDITECEDLCLVLRNDAGSTSYPYFEKLDGTKFAFSGYDANKLGEQLVTITYGNLSAQFIVTVITEADSKKVTDVSFSIQKVVYVEGESFDFEGLSIYEIYGYGYDRNTVNGNDVLANISIVGFDTTVAAKTAKKTITINYNKDGKVFSTEKTITVISSAYASTITRVEMYYGSSNKIFIVGDTDIEKWYSFPEIRVTYGDGYRVESYYSFYGQSSEVSIKLAGYDNQKEGKYETYISVNGSGKDVYRGYGPIVTFITEEYSNTPTSISAYLQNHNYDYNRIYVVGDEISVSINVTYGGGYKTQSFNDGELTGLVKTYDNTKEGWTLASFDYYGLKTQKVVKFISKAYSETITDVYLSSGENTIIAVDDTEDDLLNKVYVRVEYGGGYKNDYISTTDIKTHTYSIEGFTTVTAGVKKARLVIDNVGVEFTYRVINESDKTKVTSISANVCDIDVNNTPETVGISVQYGYGYDYDYVYIDFSNVIIDLKNVEYGEMRSYHVSYGGCVDEGKVWVYNNNY